MALESRPQVEWHCVFFGMFMEQQSKVDSLYCLAYHYMKGFKRVLSKENEIPYSPPTDIS
jgi:hypothetical protein